MADPLGYLRKVTIEMRKSIRSNYSYKVTFLAARHYALIVANRLHGWSLVAENRRMGGSDGRAQTIN